MVDQHDAEIARGLRAGSREAWCALYDAHAERVWRLSARLMGPVSADVADVVQETFMAAARSAGTYDASRGSLWSWLSGIARKRVAMHFRRQRRDGRFRGVDGELAPGTQSIVDWLENRQSSPPEALASAELSMLVRAALAELPVRYQTLLIARYFEGVGVDELASQEGCSPAAIRSKLARARGVFRRAFVSRPQCSADADAGGSHES